MKYAQVYDGDWIKPVRTGYRMKCCDCSLIHVLDFKIVKRGNRTYLFFRAARHKRATSAARRKQ